MSEPIRIGTAGWSYKDSEGQVYPKPRPRGIPGTRGHDAWLRAGRAENAVVLSVRPFLIGGGCATAPVCAP